MIKTIIIKDNRNNINKIKIIDYDKIVCNCPEFKLKNKCKHINKLKELFKI